MNINIRNIEEKDIEAVVNIQIDGWQTAYKGIIDDTYLKSMNAKERINVSKNIVALILENKYNLNDYERLQYFKLFNQVHIKKMKK